jgi:hypothetical protein
MRDRADGGGMMSVTAQSILKIHRHPESGDLYRTMHGKRFPSRGVETLNESRSKDQ